MDLTFIFLGARSEVSYYRGLHYEREKVKVKFKGNQHSAKPQNEVHQVTAEKLAQQHKVSKPTIERDAQFARAVDKVAKAAGSGAKTTLLSRDTKVTKQDAVKLGAIAQILKVYGFGSCDKPRQGS